jgi:tetratricopeptide (TPR) repeat protein
VRLWPDHFEAHRQLARALTDQGKCDEALVHFTAAINLCRDRHESKVLRRERAMLGARRGAWAEAAAPYAEMLKEHPEMLEGELGVGCYCDQAFLSLLAGDGTGHRRICLGLIDRLERQPEPRNAYAVVRVAGSSYQEGIDPKRLIQLAQTSAGRNTFHPSYLHALGLAYYRAGKPDEALPLLLRSLWGTPTWSSQPINWVALALVYQRLGKTAEAKSYLAKFRAWMDESGNGPRYPWGGLPLHPHDWMECLVLAREADALLGQPDSPKK